MAPELAVPGKTTAVLVTLHGPTKPVNITLRLLGDGAEELNQQLVETTQEITGKSKERTFYWSNRVKIVYGLRDKVSNCIPLTSRKPYSKHLRQLYTVLNQPFFKCVYMYMCIYKRFKVGVFRDKVCLGSFIYVGQVLIFLKC